MADLYEYARVIRDECEPNAVKNALKRIPFSYPGYDVSLTVGSSANVPQKGSSLYGLGAFWAMVDSTFALFIKRKGDGFVAIEQDLSQGKSVYYAAYSIGSGVVRKGNLSNAIPFANFFVLLDSAVSGNFPARSTSQAIDSSQNPVTADGIKRQIDQIQIYQNVLDVVGTNAALEAYPTSGLKTDDKIEVLADETRNGANDIYRWNDHNQWEWVGSRTASGVVTDNSGANYISSKTNVQSSLTELDAQMKTRMVDKTNTGTEAMAGSISASQFVSKSGATSLVVKELGTVASSDLVSTKIPAGFSGLVSFFVSDYSNRPCIALIKFDITNTLISWVLFQNYGASAPQSVVLGYGVSYSSATFANLCIGVSISKILADFNDVTGVNANLGGTPKCAFENSTLHIRGSFTPTSTIAAGQKLFSTGQTLGAQMTHGSAINTGAVSSATFVGIAIATNGDVYTLGALTSGVTYNIAVTATL